MGETNQRPRSISGPLASSANLGRSVNDDLESLTPAALPQISAVIAGKYRIDRLIARGGMGAVYAATHLVSGKRVALKWMLPSIGQIPDARERFIREACATARIDHPNIVDIYDVGDERGSVYLVMEYLRGETLCERLERELIPAQEAIALFIPALRGVAAAHAHGVIHRDLKPDNIFLCRTAEGDPLEPKVLDFGISKITGAESRDHSLTRSGAVLGTPYYMSPEQVRGARDVDQRADVYAFGVMLYEVLTGHRPFDAETYNQLILKIVTETPAPMASLNPSVDPRLVQIVERAMARDPNTRFPTIDALAMALEPFSGGVRFRSSSTPYGRSIPSIEISPTLLEDALGPSASRNSQASSAAALPALAQSTSSSRAKAARKLTTIASAVVALLLCSAGFLWLHESSSQPEAAALQEHVLSPASAQPAAASAIEQPAQAALLPAPSAAHAETTTNAAETASEQAKAVIEQVAAPATNSISSRRAELAAGAKSHPAAQNRKGSGRSKPVPHEAAQPNPKRVTGDWDERLSNMPARPGDEAVPAGHIDAHDFR